MIILTFVAYCGDVRLWFLDTRYRYGFFPHERNRICYSPLLKNTSLAMCAAFNQSVMYFKSRLCTTHSNSPWSCWLFAGAEAQHKTELFQNCVVGQSAESTAQSTLMNRFSDSVISKLKQRHHSSCTGSFIYFSDIPTEFCVWVLFQGFRDIQQWTEQRCEASFKSLNFSHFTRQRSSSLSVKETREVRNRSTSLCFRCLCPGGVSDIDSYRRMGRKFVYCNWK